MAGAKAQIELSVVGGAGVRQAASEVGKFGEAIKGAGGALRAFGAASGIGRAMNLVGAGGLAGMAAAIGAIVADSVRLANEFNRVSQRTVFSLTTQSGTILANLREFQAKANSPEMRSYGLGPVDAARMGGAYGMTAGATPRQTIANMDALAGWSKGYGLDPTTFAMQMGLVNQFTRSNVDHDASVFFGGASQSGQAGRRPMELLATAAQTLQQIASSRPDAGSVSMRDAMREIVGVTRLGGLYQSGYGLSTTLGAINALGGNKMGNPLMASLAYRSGWDMTDIAVGVGNNPKKIFPFIRTLFKQFGPKNPYIGVALEAAGLNDEQARWIMGTHGKLGEADVANVLRGGRDSAYRNSTTGQMEQAMANLQKVETDLGEAIVTKLAPELKTLSGKVDQWIDSFEHGKVAQALESMVRLERLGDLVGILGLLGGGGSAFKLLGLLGRGVGAAGAVAGAAGGVEGIGTVLAGLAASGAIAGFGYGLVYDLKHPELPYGPGDVTAMNNGTWAGPGGGSPTQYGQLGSYGRRFSNLDGHIRLFYGHGRFAPLSAGDDFYTPWHLGSAGTQNSVGIRPGLRGLLRELAGAGYGMGFMVMNQGHVARNTAHAAGMAADLDTLNGHLLWGSGVNPEEVRFAQQALTDPAARLGIANDDLYQVLLAQYGSTRVFSDHGTGTHIHVEEDNPDTDIEVRTSVKKVKPRKKAGGVSRSAYK